jgi:hypothetical protein
MPRFTPDADPPARPTGWHNQPRIGRLAAVMYPHLTDAATQREMAQLAANEQKKSPTQGRIDAERARREQARTKRR